MRKIIMNVCALIMFAVLTTAAGQAMAQTKKMMVDVQSTEVSKSRGANPNIKTGVPTVDVPAEKSRGNCEVTFDNYTGLYVNVYVDGNYKGTVGPYEDGTVTVGGGYTTIYCVSTGGTREWAAAGNCEEEYVYKLK